MMALGEPALPASSASARAQLSGELRNLLTEFEIEFFVLDADASTTHGLAIEHAG